MARIDAHHFALEVRLLTPRTPCYSSGMSAAERLLSEVLALPIPERAKLAHRLLESLEAVPDEDIDAVWLTELEKRAQDVQTGTVTPIPWETARGNIASELRKRREARTTP
jgi:putative addiction module component (TIGR02574 family)